ncbi:hypothetical protein PO124_22615, partial [Bacillus licheniformis]|nr:hypothetical protein [Bacillus licheniformis]
IPVCLGMSQPSLWAVGDILTFSCGKRTVEISFSHNGDKIDFNNARSEKSNMPDFSGESCRSLIYTAWAMYIHMKTNGLEAKNA